jgi:ATP-dependent helicase HrpA
MNFRVQDEHGRIVGQSRNLAELRTKYRDQVAARFQSARIVPADAPAPKKGAPRRRRPSAQAPGAPNAAEPRLAGFTGWSFGPLPELLEVKVAGREIVGFPALHDDGSSVSLRPYDTPEEAAKVHRGGLARCSRWSSRPR